MKYWQNRQDANANAARWVTWERTVSATRLEESAVRGAVALVPRVTTTTGATSEPQPVKVGVLVRVRVGVRACVEPDIHVQTCKPRT
jgi:hypothetical protein